MDDLFNVNPKITTAIFGLIGYIILDDLTADEQNVVGNWLMLTSQVLITNSASQLLIQNKIINNHANINDIKNKLHYNPVIYDIEYIREILRNTEKDHIGNIVEILNKKIKKIEETLEELKKY